VIGIPFTWFGCMQFYSATQDLCFQVYGRRARQLYPWDLESPHSTDSEMEAHPRKDSSEAFDLDIISAADNSLGSPRSATFSLRPTRKSRIFEEEIPIEDEYVKKVQRARYIRTWVLATTIAVILIAVFLAVPNY